MTLRRHISPAASRPVHVLFPRASITPSYILLHCFVSSCVPSPLRKHHVGRSLSLPWNLRGMGGGRRGGWWWWGGLVGEERGR